MNNAKLIKKKCKAIKLMLTDVDGVLTDGGMYYTESGEYMKKFNARDGMAVELLDKENIKTAFITREKSTIVKKRAIKLSISKYYLGIKNKESGLPLDLGEAGAARGPKTRNSMKIITTHEIQGISRNSMAFMKIKKFCQIG